MYKVTTNKTQVSFTELKGALIYIKACGYTDFVISRIKDKKGGENE